jgi:hypothetical protein
MLGMSNLLPQLATMMPPGGPIYALYGDPAYPQSAYLIGGISGAQDGSDEAAWNTAMSTGRIAVEWTFGEVGRQFRQLDLKHGLQIFRTPSPSTIPLRCSSSTAATVSTAAKRPTTLIVSL